MYRIRYAPGALRSLGQLQKKESARILSALERLAEADEPSGMVKRLKGRSAVPFFSLRVGDYRVVLTFEHKTLVIFVVAIEHRSTVYRNF